MKNNIFILGDSYSTYDGWIPAGYDCYYGDETENEPKLKGVEKTWWHQLKTLMDYTLIKNDSYSGTTVCTTSYGGNILPDRAFVGRLDRYIAEGFFKDNDIDTMFVFGGTNDSWAESPIGELLYENWTEEDLKATLPAFCYLMHRIRTISEDMRLVVILSDELKPEIRENYTIAGEKYGAEIVTLKEIQKENGHPTELGMSQIYQQVKAVVAK